MALTLPRPGLCPLAWFALVPLLSDLSRARSDARAAASGAAFGLGFYGLTFRWIYSTCRFAHIPYAGAGAPLQAATSLAAWAALAGAMSLNWLVFALAAARLRRGLPGWAWPPACAAVWAALEFAGSRFTPGLDLVLLAYTQWRFPSWVQGVALAGPHVLSFLVVFWNAALAAWLADKTQGFLRPPLAGFSRRSGLFVLGAPAALLLAWWMYGAWALRGAPAAEAIPAARRGRSASGLGRVSGDSPAAITHRIAVLQPDIDQYVKWDERYADWVRGTFNELLGRAREQGADLVVWPESAVPGWFDDPDNFHWVREWALGGGANGAYQLVGALTRRREPGGGPSGTRRGRDAESARNSAVLVNPRGEVAGYYDKRRLVPFGEFVPIRFLDRFIGLLAQMGDLEPGPAVQPPLATPLGKTGVTVCYEALFPFLNRTGPGGARVLVNVTNDGWYKDTWGPYQHFYANRYRAAENRVYVVRAANTGISGVFDPYGRVLASLTLETRGVLSAEIPDRDPFPARSPYARRGDWFGWACLIAAALLLGAGRASKEAGP